MEHNSYYYRDNAICGVWFYMLPIVQHVLKFRSLYA